MENTTNHDKSKDGRNEGGGAKIWDDQNVADRGASSNEQKDAQENRSGDQENNSKFDGQNSGDRNGGLERTELDKTD